MRKYRTLWYFLQCLLLHHCGWILLADFKLLISCDCGPGMNTNNFLVSIWPKLDSRKCQSGLWGVFQGTDFGPGGEVRLCLLGNVLAIEYFWVYFSVKLLRKWKLFNASLGFAQLICRVLFFYSKLVLLFSMKDVAFGVFALYFC